MTLRVYTRPCCSIALLRFRATSAETKVVAFAPVNAEDTLRTLLTPIGAFEYMPQPDGDLGRADGGSDAVGLCVGGPSGWSSSVRTVLRCQPRTSTRGLALLREKEVVLGPSTDGGYYLVGRRNGESRIFQDVAWSTGTVLRQTLERLGKQSLGVLPPWYDVDTPADAGFLKVHLEALARAGSTQGRHSLAVLRDLELPQP